MVTTDFFKSYDGAWLEARDYGRMTEWLGGVFVRRPRPRLEGVRDVQAWRERLREDGVYVTYSSGTSGRLSFVPRDAFTWNALRRNGAYCAGASAAPPSGGYDCLVLGARGNGLGIQAAARGLTRVARRSHYLFDVELGADVLVDGAAARRFAEATSARKEDAYDAAFAFLLRSTEDAQAVVVFGAPAQVSEACGRLLAEGRALRLPHGSVVVTGGGWKHAEGERVSREELAERVERALGVRPAEVVDTYSMSECNCVFPSCPEGRYHVPPLVELVALDESYLRLDGDDVRGTIGFLDPFAASYPGFVITGDEGRLVRDRCACGLAGWAILGEIVRAGRAEPKGCAGVVASALA